MTVPAKPVVYKDLIATQGITNRWNPGSQTVPRFSKSKVFPFAITVFGIYRWEPASRQLITVPNRLKTYKAQSPQMRSIKKKRKPSLFLSESFI
jgi:hypothetical protein